MHLLTTLASMLAFLIHLVSNLMFYIKKISLFFEKKIIGNTVWQKGGVLVINQHKLLKINTMNDRKKVVRLLEPLPKTDAGSFDRDGLTQWVGPGQAVGYLNRNITTDRKGIGLFAA